MQITISNYRGCKSASVKGGPILIVGARNGNGKTSLLEGVALAATKWAVPKGIAKKDAGTLLYQNTEGMRAAKGMVSVSLETGAMHATYPKGEVQSEGKATVSPVAAGLVRLPTLAPDALAAALSSIVNALPTLDDVLKAFADVKIDAKIAGAVWAKIEASSWDAAYKAAQERGALVKAEWQTITGQRWGSAIGESWRPEGWDDALLVDETTEEDVAALRDRRNEALKAAAFDEGTMAAIADDVALLDKRFKIAQAAEAEEDTALTALREAEKHQGSLPRPDKSGHDMPCPHCGAFCRLDQVDRATMQLVKADESRHKTSDLDKMRSDIAAADGTLANRRIAYTEAKARSVDAMAALARSQGAVAKQKEAAEAAGNRIDAVQAERDFDDAANRVARRNAYIEASSKHQGIKGNADIQDLLSPAGLRAKALKRGLEAFNREHLTPLCALGGWPSLFITDDLTVEWEGKPWGYSQYSGAEQWLASAVMQIAVARADGSPLVILDGADILDSRNRNALFSVLPEIGIEALVGMTYNKPTQVPDLPAAELGARFWIKDGVSEAIA